MRKIIASSAVCLIVLGVGVSVSAEEPTAKSTAEVKDQGNTDLRIGFENDSTIKPVEPGTIGLSRIPTAFDFGQSNRIIDKPQVIKTNNSISQAPQYVAVKDSRSTKSGPWNVSVKASPIVNMDQSVTTGNTLEGTNLSFATKAVTFKDNDDKGKASLYSPTATPEFTTTNVTRLKTDGTTSIPDVLNTTDASAVKSEEVGAQITDVSLYVPANVGTPNALYTGTVTWTLEATPS